ncbi:MAG: LysM peptidoglycan-binding domain-containing protein [Anaerolineales bacterium]|nr:LysM peptidoglycan-binding domain-containing protein [Anaerolineales bacterium]
MSNKGFAQVSVLVLFLLAFLVTPLSVQAGGVCGGTYVVEQGETVETIAAKCGTKVSAIYAANPGISGSLYTGQVLTVPGSNYNNQSNNEIYSSNNGTYIVQYGDTFSVIASRFGVSMYDLWIANPYIWDINVLYAGQVIHVPGSSWVAIVPTPAKTPIPLSYGTVPKGTPYGAIKLSNKANADVYVSLQGTTRDGIQVINEYPVSKTLNVEVPAGWYVYVAWVGGQKFVGQFNLGGDSDHSITFYSNKVTVD